jgi:hypothetical protein
MISNSWGSLYSPEAIAAATLLRDKMIEVRELLKPFSSENGELRRDWAEAKYDTRA